MSGSSSDIVGELERLVERVVSPTPGTPAETAWTKVVEGIRAHIAAAERSRDIEIAARNDQWERRKAAESRAMAAEASVEQLVGDVRAVSQDYTNTLNLLRAANARLLENGHKVPMGSYCC